MTAETEDLRALLSTLDRPCDPTIIRSGYGRLSDVLQRQAARR